jgi:hypothetical protein
MRGNLGRFEAQIVREGCEILTLVAIMESLIEASTTAKTLVSKIQRGN